MPFRGTAAAATDFKLRHPFIFLPRCSVYLWTEIRAAAGSWVERNVTHMRCGSKHCQAIKHQKYEVKEHEEQRQPEHVCKKKKAAWKVQTFARS